MCETKTMSRGIVLDPGSTECINGKGSVIIIFLFLSHCEYCMCIEHLKQEVMS